MNPGTWADWFAAFGTIAAAGGTLWLLKREGDDRRELQRNEDRRQTEARRRQASNVYVSALTRLGGSSDGSTWFARPRVTVRNLSDGVLHEVSVRFTARDYELAPSEGQSTIELGRMLPGDERDVDGKFEWRFGVQQAPPNTPPHSTDVLTRFTDAAGVKWQVDSDHTLSEQ